MAPKPPNRCDSAPSHATHQTRPSFLARHKPSAVVLASQISAALAHGAVKALESRDGDDAVDPFQILLIRTFITGVGCSLFLWHQRVPEFPLGERQVRPMLLLRAVGGILGAGGMYYSIKYLTLSQATALNFLAPMGAMILSKYMDYGSFTAMDKAGAIIALAGVVMVVQPDNLFHRDSTWPIEKTGDTVTKFKGLGCGIIGVIGTVIALATMRRIGSRAHPLTIVNYFAWVVFLAAAVMAIVGGAKWPTSFSAWEYMIVIGVLGGIMEYLLTLGIASDTSSVATIMIYSQVIWALLLDRIFWHVSISVWTFIGVANVIGSLTLVSLAKEVAPLRKHEVLYDAVANSEDHDGVTVHEIDLDDLFSSASSDEHV